MVAMPPCTHLDHVMVTELPVQVAGCEDCLRSGDPWLHLRICLECGYVGCCDSSPNRHASAHARSTDHPLIRSLEPGEEWSWCFVDEVALAIPGVQGETRIPPSPLA
ncbi:MAG: hypothetical protein QOI10_3090 [Solirubrobacterales bacterium]|jgi:uncharacterized UBP type Zn finger protein|nr:hypothetical protein [Solirubrobacterales bacterium]